MDVFNNTTILGNGHTVTTGCTIVVNDGTRLDLRSTFTLDGSPDAKDCMIQVKGEFNMYDTILTGRSAPYGECAGVYIDEGGQFCMYEGSRITNCTAAGRGTSGAVYNYKGKFHMYGGEISSSNGDYAGGVFNNEATFYMKNGSITGNTATNGAGGIYMETKGSFTMDGGSITSNTGTSGGGIYSLEDGEITINGGDITYNVSAAGTGGIGSKGGVLLSGGSVTINGGSISCNTGKYLYGGGVYVRKSRLNITGGLISANSGSGIRIENCKDSSISGCTIRDNTSDHNGGGIYIADTNVSLGDGVVITKNHCNMVGGGIIVDEGSLSTTANAVIVNNTADEEGADIYKDNNTKLSGFYSDPSTFDTEYRDGRHMKVNNWFHDDKDKRYTPSASGTPISGDEIRDTSKSSALTLVASYAAAEISYQYMNPPKGAVPPESVLVYTNTAFTPTYPELLGYTFDGWYTNQACTDKFDDGRTVDCDMTLFGRWVKAYKISYEFKTDPEGLWLPAPVTDLRPADKYYAEHSDVTPSGPEKGTVVNWYNINWMFMGYTPDMFSDLSSDDGFTGTWVRRYKVIYNFVSTTSDKTIPAEVEKLEPTDSNYYTQGETVEAEQPEKKQVITEDDGTWIFMGYDKDSAVIGESNVTFTGKWSFCYSVKYEFASGTDGHDIPDALQYRCPVDSNTYPTGTVIKAIQLHEDERIYKYYGNVWVFTGYDADEKTVGDEDVTFKGIWKWTNKDDPENGYSVSYAFQSGTRGMDLPAEVTGLLPADSMGHKRAEVIIPEEPDTTIVDVKGGTWTFQGYDSGKTVIVDKDVKYTGTWTFTEGPEPEEGYTVSYDFEASPMGAVIPAEIYEQYKPKDSSGHKRGETVTPPGPAEGTIHAVDGGYWEFIYYSPRSATIKDQDVRFIGYWYYEDTYKVEYKFESLTEGRDIPDEVNRLLPATTADHRRKETVIPEYPSTDMVPVSDGKWYFIQYDAESKIVGREDVVFTGSWQFVETEETYLVSYKFETGTPGVTLPQEVHDLTPEDKNEYYRGDIAEILQPSETVVNVDDGTWIFEGYDIKSSMIEVVKDTVITGTWTFSPGPTPEKTYNVSYSFESSTKGKTLPAQVLELQPANTKGHKSGEVITPSSPAAGDIVVTTDGIWTFGGYTPKTATITDANVSFKGVWTFEAAYKVSYDFASVTSGQTIPDEVLQLLPADTLGHRDGEKIAPEMPSQTTVRVSSGTWSFAGYIPSSATISGADVQFTGNWAFTADPEPGKTYRVRYSFVSNTRGRNLPETVTALIPTDSKSYKNGTVITPVKPAKTSVAVSKGTWTFTGYVPETATIDNADITFCGSWKYTANGSGGGGGGGGGGSSSGLSVLADTGGIHKGWYKDDAGIWYYYNEFGTMVRGWHFDAQDGRWYYLSLADGHMLTGWQLIDGKWHLFNSAASAQTWNLVGGEWVYNGSASRPLGSMYMSEQTPDNYFVDANGVWKQD